MDYKSALVGCVFVFLMLASIHVRRKLIEKSCCITNATLDSATGLFILATGALSLWCMRSLTVDVENSVYVVSSELTKLLTSAVGAMYLKQGYEKHDKDWMEKQNKNQISAGGNVEQVHETKS